MNKIDLHTHSNFSIDGEVTADALLTMAKENNIKYYAIADHNTTKGVIEALKQVPTNMIFIPAIELDCNYKGINFHLLGYNINPTDTLLLANEERIDKQSLEAGQKQIEQIEKLGIYIDIEQLKKNKPSGIYAVEDMAEIFLQDSRNDDLEILLPYRKNGARSDNPLVNFYWDYCSQNKPAYVPTNYPSVDEAINMVHHANGFCVIAHPGINFSDKQKELIELLNKPAIEGIEVYSSYHNGNEINHYLKMANTYNKIITVGSDFHGKTKPAIKMGTFVIPDEENIIKNFMNKVKKEI